LWQPPEWTDDYYDKQKRQSRLDQIVDTTFSIKSQHAGLVQVADLFAFILRRYAEMTDFGQPEEWVGEQALIKGCAATLAERLLPRSWRWPSRQVSGSSKWFNSVAPTSLMALGK
jgi:hypothetical protein